MEVGSRGPVPTTTREDGAVTSVFCFLLSALSLAWVLVVISPQAIGR